MTLSRALLVLALALAVAACGGSSSGTDGGGSDSGADPCAPHTFHVTSDGASYSFDGAAGDSDITMCRGVTYMLDLTAVSSFHPMALKAGGPTGSMLAMIPPGMVTSYTVPMAAPLPDTYVCMVHGFNGHIAVP